MTEPDDERLGPLMTEFGESIAAEVGHLPDRAYVLAYCENNWAQIEMYVDEGEVLRRYFGADDKLHDIAMEIWQVDNGSRKKALRWIYFEYDIVEGKFNAHFFFPEDIRPGTDIEEWEKAGLQKRFGDKRIIQPPDPFGDDLPSH